MQHACGNGARAVVTQFTALVLTIEAFVVGGGAVITGARGDGATCLVARALGAHAVLPVLLRIAALMLTGGLLLRVARCVARVQGRGIGIRMIRMVWHAVLLAK